MKTELLLLFILSTGFFCKGQNETKVLELKKQQYFTEQNILSSDTTISLLQEVCYDVPEVSDEAYCLKLDILILDSTKALQSRRIYINKDSSIVKCIFKRHSYMPTPKNGATINISGTINIISWGKRSVALDMNLKIIDKNWNHIYIYKGKRNFLRKHYKKNCC
ncbi:hypothetical protein [Ferruginibacter albus]|uniref:hypothetical protein n=1 Tax=Ferruginibacter albus TaxID=2875540 RepID=UPI001CC49491|nr:hypothetical protein [Ferruginibacter albus]UAY52084.1 hypothetical protein K9M53_16025 [Ferruginibacter albus]